MAAKDMRRYKLAHQLKHVGELCEFLADSLETMIKEAGGDADASNIVTGLREVGEESDEVSDDIVDSVR